MDLNQWQLYLSGDIWKCLEVFLVDTTGGGWHRYRCYWHPVGGSQGCCYTSDGAQTTPTKKYLALKVNSAEAEKPRSGLRPTSDGSSNLWELPGLLCPVTGLASLPRLPQELKPLSRVPFGSGQVSPVEFPAGQAVHQLELLCVIIYSHRTPVFI